MSFVNKRLGLQKESPNGHPFKLCAKCEEKNPPECGADMGRGQWICAACWTLRAIRRPNK